MVEIITNHRRYSARRQPQAHKTAVKMRVVGEAVVIDRAALQRRSYGARKHRGMLPVYGAGRKAMFDARRERQATVRGQSRG